MEIQEDCPHCGFSMEWCQRVGCQRGGALHARGVAAQAGLAAAAFVLLVGGAVAIVRWVLS